MIQTAALGAHRHGAPEQGHGLLGRGGRRNVVVLRLNAQQHVPDAAAGEHGTEAGLGQFPDNADGEGPELVSRRACLRHETRPSYQ